MVTQIPKRDSNAKRTFANWENESSSKCHSWPLIQTEKEKAIKETKTDIE